MRKLAILFLSLFFWRCNSQPKIVPVKFQAEELEVIKQTFPDEYCCDLANFEVPKFLPKGWHQTKKQRERLKKFKDSISGTKPVRHIWFVKDTLYNPASFILSNKYYNDPRIKIDTAFTQLEKVLFTELYPKQAAKLSNLIIGKQIFKPIDSAEKSIQIQKHFVLLSRVVFNSTRDKACYYLSQSFTQPHNNWSEEEMMFVEKRQGKWHLIYRKLYGIT